MYRLGRGYVTIVEIDRHFRMEALYRAIAFPSFLFYLLLQLE
jgi:hypothetical protein